MDAVSMLASVNQITKKKKPIDEPAEPIYRLAKLIDGSRPGDRGCCCCRSSGAPP